jgi:septal ring factor EnvC (AmiA/AmiB activator)
MFKIIGSVVMRWLGGGTLAALLAMGSGWLWHDWQTGRLEERLAEARGESTDLRTSLSQWQAEAERRMYALNQVRQDAREAEAAMRELEARLEKTDAAYEKLRKQISATPDSDDGPVAPVLRKTLEDLP